MIKNKRRILITGGTGFLGKSIIRDFLHSDSFDEEIIVIGRSLEKLNKVFPNELILKEETDYSIESLNKITQDVDTVIHLASLLMQRDTNLYKVSPFVENINLTENLLISSHRNEVKQFINISSISVYHKGIDLKETDFLKPSNIYGVSKACIESFLAYFQTKSSMNIVSLRLARLYGFGERSGLVFSDFIEKSRSKIPITIHGDGSSTIEYIYIKDVIEVLKIILKCESLRGVYNIGTGRPTSIKEIGEVIASIFGNNVVFDKMKPDGEQGSVMNVSKIKRDLNWKSKWHLERAVLDIKKLIENEQQ